MTTCLLPHTEPKLTKALVWKIAITWMMGYGRWNLSNKCGVKWKSISFINTIDTRVRTATTTIHSFVRSYNTFEMSNFFYSFFFINKKNNEKKWINIFIHGHFRWISIVYLISLRYQNKKTWKLCKSISAGIWRLFSLKSRQYTDRNYTWWSGGNILFNATRTEWCIVSIGEVNWLSLRFSWESISLSYTFIRSSQTPLECFPLYR